MLRAVRKVLPGCDMVHFQKMHAEIEGKANPLLQFGHVVAMKERCYGIEVTRPWGELSKDIMQSRLRSTIRQQRKKIQALGPLSLEHYADGGAMTPAMNVLWEMRRGRFNRINRADTPEVWRSFYYDVVCNPARKLDVSISILRVGACGLFLRPVAGPALSERDAALRRRRLGGIPSRHADVRRDVGGVRAEDRFRRLLRLHHRG